MISVIRFITLLLCVVISSAAFSASAYVGDKEGFYNQAFNQYSYAPGSLLSYQRAYRDSDSFVNVPSNHSIYRILYVSNTKNGDTRSYSRNKITSGLVFIPNYSPPSAGFQTLVFSHGTAGMLPKCGPSYSETLQLKPWMFSNTIKTVAPDYFGLGYDSGFRSSDVNHSRYFWWSGHIYPFNQSTHPYFDMPSSGKNSLDIVDAANQLEKIVKGTGYGNNKQFAVIGRSQGGATAQFAGELSTTYTPHLDLLAVASLAGGATRLEESYNDILTRDRPWDGNEGDSELFKVFIPVLLVALSMQENISPAQWLTSDGEWNYNISAEKYCANETAWYSSLAGSHPLVKYSGESDVQSYRRFLSTPVVVNSLTNNTAATRPISAPVYLGHASLDPLAPYMSAEGAYNDYKNLNTDVILCTVPNVADDDDYLFERLNNHFETESQACLLSNYGTACKHYSNGSETLMSINTRRFLYNAGLSIVPTAACD